MKGLRIAGITIYGRKAGKMREGKPDIVRQELYIFFKQFKIKIHKSLNISGERGIEHF